MSKVSRIIRHAIASPMTLRRLLPKAAMQRIEEEIAKSEKSHSGEIRFAVEVDLDAGQILRGVTARKRAIDTFSQLRIWDTEENTGVLVYLLLADRQLEIVADRGIHKKVGDDTWSNIARQMEKQFAEGDFEGGVLAGIRSITALLTKHFPASSTNQNELSNKPVVM
ncbi:MAG: TPM domain-containing protein [Leptospirales bacterium]|nr:TPM domain-containing protein [Leptospirales bacterium]